ncbi:MAG: XisI protein [Elainellaceae cyanobacterium]
MDKLERYQTAIKRVLTQYHDWVASAYQEPDESLLIFDDTHNQYIWMQVGWTGKRRNNGIQVHARIKNGKIWIEEDWTETGIATELVNLGISPKEIVLAFHHPDERSLTDFAAA